jgi:hypothetical protein
MIQDSDNIVEQRNLQNNPYWVCHRITEQFKTSFDGVFDFDRVEAFQQEGSDVGRYILKFTDKFVANPQKRKPIFYMNDVYRNLVGKIAEFIRDMNAIYGETLTRVDSDIKNVNQTGIYDTNLKQETGSVIVGFMSDKFGLTSDGLKLTDPYIVHSIQFVIKLTENIADSEVALSVLFNDAIPFETKLSPIRELPYQTIHYVVK